MHISKCWVLTVLAVLLSVAVAEFEVLNDVNEGERDDFLESEQFIPADAISKENAKASQRNLASVKQTGQQGKVTNSNLKVKEESKVPPKAAPVKSSSNTNNADVKKMTSQTASASQGGVPAQKSGPMHIGAAERGANDDEDVDLATEGFLLVEPKAKPQSGHAASSRKLAQVDETYSQEESHRTRNVRLMSQESEGENLESDIASTQPKRDVNILKDLKKSSDSSSSSSSESTPSKDSLSSSSSSSSTSSSPSSLYSESQGHHEVKPHIAEGRHEVHERLQKIRKGRPDRKTRLMELENMDQEDFEDEDWVELSIVCMDKSSWECLMFKEDYLAARQDSNFSNRVGNREAERVRRQVVDYPDYPTNVDVGVDAGVDVGSGNETIFVEVIVEEPNLLYESQSTFQTTETPESFAEDPKKVQETSDDLEKQLRDLFKGMTGFLEVYVDPHSLKVENGTLQINWRVVLNGGDPSFLGQDPSQINDTLSANLDDIRNGYKNGINIDGFPPLDDFDFDNILKQLDEQLTNPCNNKANPSPCSVGYHKCVQVEDLFRIKCTHKCVTFNNNRPCEHGTQCDLNMNNEPYCPCTSHFKGKYCEERVASIELDGGEITGIVLGGILCAAGVVGCCCWFFLCFRKDDDMIYTHYTDEEGSGAFSEPSAQLGAVIDRPHISVSPISVFKPPSQTA